LAATGEEMENENQPMDSDARTDAALAAFSGDEETDPAAVDPTPDPAADPAAAADPNADPAAVDPNTGQITDEQLQADPRYTELTDFRDNVVNALQEFPGLVDDKGMPNMNEAALQLRDASVLYDIMQGKGTPSALLEVMGQNANWTPEQKQAIAQDLIGWLTKGGFLKDGQAAQPQAGAKDPVTARLDKIENERKTEQQRQEQQRVQTHQKQVFDTKFLPKVKELAKQKGVPEEDFADYATRVAGMINGNKAILARIEKGNFVDVQKFFTQVFNAEAARLQRWTKAQTAAAQKKTQNPRIPAGGAPPAPAGSAKPINAKSREDRIAAAADML
jgi:hypothetical protein